MTVDEPKTLIHVVMPENVEAWRESLEILADKKRMKQTKQADSNWAPSAKGSYAA